MMANIRRTGPLDRRSKPRDRLTERMSLLIPLDPSQRAEKIPKPRLVVEVDSDDLLEDMGHLGGQDIPDPIQGQLGIVEEKRSQLEEDEEEGDGGHEEGIGQGTGPDGKPGPAYSL